MFKKSYKYDKEADDTINGITGIKLNHICANCGWSHGEHYDPEVQRCPTWEPIFKESPSQKSTQAFDHRFFKYYQRLSDRKII